jgi:hypothetical protein
MELFACHELGRSRDGLAPLAALHRLEVLLLPKCGLSNDSLAPLQKCTALKQLNLSYNPITDDGITNHFANLNDLKSVDLSGTQTGNNSAICLLQKPNLEELHMSQTLVNSGIFSNLFKTTRAGKMLKRLNLFASPYVQKIDFLKDLVPPSGDSALEAFMWLAPPNHLDIKDDIAAISYHKRMNELVLCNIAMWNAKLMNYICSLPQLETLSLWISSTLCRSVLKLLGKLPKLKIFDLHVREDFVTRRYLENIPSLPKLETLLIESFQSEHSNIDTLFDEQLEENITSEKFPSLKNVMLSVPNHSIKKQSTVQHVCSFITSNNVRELNVSLFGNFFEKGYVEVPSLPSLRSLTVKNVGKSKDTTTTLHDFIRHASELRKITLLDGKSTINDTLLDLISQSCPKLQEIAIVNCPKISQNVLPKLASLSELIFLDLSQSQINIDNLQTLSKLNQLYELVLPSQLADKIPLLSKQLTQTVVHITE